MTPGIQKVMAWSGTAFLILLFGGCIIAGLLPPPAPSETAEQAAQFWATDAGTKRFGLVVLLVSSIMQLPFGVLIAMRIKRLEGEFSPLAYVQLMACTVSVLAVVFPVFIWAAASYRPERDPEITQMLNDFGWLMLIMNVMGAVFQALSIGVAVVGYRFAEPIWPRWFGYFNLWLAFLFCGGLMAVMFKDGIFAWNGLIGLWMGAGLVGVWYIVTTWQLLITVQTAPGAEQPKLVQSAQEASAW